MKTNRMKFIVYAVLMFFLFMLVIESSYSFLGRYITFGLFKIVSLGKYGINFLFLSHFQLSTKKAQYET